MKKRIMLLTAICFLASGFTLSGCKENSLEASSGKADTAFASPLYDWDTAPRDTLTVWGTYPDLERSYIVKAFDRYRELTGNELEIVQLPKEELEQSLKDAQSGKIKEYDILLSYGGTNIDIFHPDENFYDFTDAVWVDDLTDTSINQTVYNGKIIGLPHWEASISGTLYNKEIFRANNLDIPVTQQDFINVCDTLLANGIIPMYLPGKDITMLLYQFPLDSVVENTDILDRLNSQTLGYADLPEMKTIVTWYKDMSEKGCFGNTWETDGWDSMDDAMKSGKYAMMLCWDTWLYTDFTGNPEDFGLMPAFMGVPEEGTFEGPNLGLFIVNKNSARLDTALNFITFLSDPYNYNAAFEGIYTAPVFKNQVASISTPQYLEAEHLIDTHYHDSAAWLRIKGFSQLDASCILEYMNPESTMTAKDCLLKMDELRNARLTK
ncbi:MAG: extracellular solute-binding protein [Eubacteriales bacterium]|nr:extracellular solute-binding protein [Eubacteriales bacterium]